MKRILIPATAVLFLMTMFGGTLSTSGQALAADRSLSFAVPGVIADIKVKPGMKVRQGDVLAVLDQRVLLAAKKASAAKVESMMLRSELLARRLEQTRQLYDSLSASTENVEDAEVAATQAKAELEEARAQAVITAWNLERSTLRAPFTGSITSISGYPGMVIPANGDVVPVVVIRSP